MAAPLNNQNGIGKDGMNVIADKTDNNKKSMITALEDAYGVVTMACKNVGIARQTHYEWYREDEVYRAEVDSVLDTAIDFVESELFKQIKYGEVSSTIFYLKCKGKKRGYIEKTEIEHSGSILTAVQPQVIASNSLPSGSEKDVNLD